MKKLIVTIAVLVVLIFGLFLGKNAVAKFAISKGVKATTGLGLGIESIDVGIFKSIVDAKGLTVYNPSNFREKRLAEMPFFYLNYDLGSFLKGGVHLRKLKIDLEKIVIVKNKEGKLNLSTLEKIAKKGKDKESKGKETKKKGEFKIDFLVLKIGDVLYKDYSQGTPAKVQKFEISLDQSYKNITDPHKLTSLILVEALRNTAISNLIDFNLRPFEENINTISKTTQEAATDLMEETKDAAKGARKAIEDVLPFSGKK